MAQQIRPTFLAVHAHPDDEVFGTGGTFALLAEQGVHTVLVTATGGEEGEIVDPTLNEEARQAMFPRLAEVRREELLASARVLKISELRSLGYRDSGMAGTAANQHPACFHRATFDDAVKRLVSIIRETRPQVMATYDPFGSYGHPDHIQAHRVALAAFDAAGEGRCFPDLPYPAWQADRLYYMTVSREAMIAGIQTLKAQGVPGPWNDERMQTEQMGTADDLITTRLDVRGYAEQKMRAFQAHRTQIAPDSFVFTLPEEERRQFLGFEYFLLARHALTPRRGEMETSLFAGLM